jgi:ATP:ADP antiporter, AAA family
MSFALKNIYQYVIDIEPQERSKVLYLTLSFFLVIGGYTVVREIKDSVFTSIVAGMNESGAKYQGWAKLLSMFVLIPAIFLHSRFVDIVRRHYLLYFYALFFGLGGLLFTYFLGHPTIGLPNTVASPYRIFGWLFYFFAEGYSPFLVSVFWAFANSVTSPDVAKNNYTFMIAGSKLGGILTALCAYLYLSRPIIGSQVAFDVHNHQLLLGISSVIFLFVPLVIYFLIKKVPRAHMHGYEAGYLLEKERLKKSSGTSTFKSMISGLLMLFKYPYVMGIFGMSFFFELINQAFKIENIVFGAKTATNLSGMTNFLLIQALLVHIAGFFVVVFGTRAVLQALGEKKSLMLIPSITGLSVLYFLWKQTPLAATIAFVITRSINYAFAVPLRESLYIPTIKDVQFKSKSWIDGFGTKFAKTCAANFNVLTSGLNTALRFGVQSSFFSLTIGCWFLTAYALGRRFERAVAKNEVIGLEETSEILQK